MEYDKEEARKAMDCAEKKISKNDYFGAKKFVNKAQDLYPNLEGLEQILMIIDVFISASNVGGCDWYGILGVDPLADDVVVKKQYKKLALLVHPDKNKFNGAEEAFKLVSNAYELLSDKDERSAYDRKRKSKEVKQKKTGTKQKPPKPKPEKPTKPKPKSEPEEDKGGTFWTMCNKCNSYCEYKRAKYLNKTVCCRNCGKGFVATEIDPEVINRMRKEEEEKKRAAEAAQKRKEEEDKKREAEAAQKQKKAMEKEKRLLQKERSRLRTLSAPLVAQNLLEITEEDIEFLCMSLNIGLLKKLCNNMENKEGIELETVIKNWWKYYKPPEEEEEEEKEKESKKSGAEWTSKASQSDKKQEPWSKEEIDMLKKGIVKYPKGTSQRWEVISDYIGTGRTVEEILKAIKTVLLQKPDSAKAFDSFLEKRKPTVPISSPLSTREELGESPLPTTATTNDEAGESSSDTDGWSVVQERALVQALKTFPKETSQRWEKVAEAVPGKTMIQCKKKFAELKETIRSKKKGV